MFAPSDGIKRGNDGKIEVAPKPKQPAESPKKTTPGKKEEQVAAPTSKLASKIGGGLASKIGAGAKPGIGTHSRVGSSITPAA